MIIQVNEAEMLLSFSEDMAALGYSYAGFPADQICDRGNIECFRTEWEVREYCYDMTTDLDCFKSVKIDSLRKDLNAIVQSGIDKSSAEAIDTTAFCQAIAGKRELLEDNLNRKTMNQTNLKFLEDQIKYTGFGETLQPALKEKMEKGEKEFTLQHEAQFGASRLVSDLNFKKSDQTDMYFFNTYKASLSNEGTEHNLEQIFYVGKDNNFTMKEAFNLLEGRSVNKDMVNKQGEAYNTWCRLDFTDAEKNGNFKMTHYHQNYGYSLEAALEKHSIKELQTPKFKEDLMNSLKKGNIQSVTVVVNGEERKRFVEANPQFKTVKMYDASMERINDRESKDQKKSESESQSASKETKKGQENEGDSEDSGGKKKQSRKRGASIS